MSDLRMGFFMISFLEKIGSFEYVSFIIAKSEKSNPGLPGYACALWRI
jgi:hypothetical protein